MTDCYINYGTGISAVEVYTTGILLQGSHHNYKRDILELPSGHVIVITYMYSKCVLALFRACCIWCLHTRTCKSQHDCVLV